MVLLAPHASGWLIWALTERAHYIFDLKTSLYLHLVISQLTLRFRRASPYYDSSSALQGYKLRAREPQTILLRLGAATRLMSIERDCNRGKPDLVDKFLWFDPLLGILKIGSRCQQEILTTVGHHVA